MSTVAVSEVATILARVEAAGQRLESAKAEQAAALAD